MAIVWGGWSETATQGFRVGCDVSTSSTATQTTITYEFYVQSQQSVNQDQTLSLSGEATGNYVFRNSGGTIKVRTVTITKSRIYGTAQTVEIRAQLTGTYNGLSPSGRWSGTVPARAYSAPAPPSGLSASYSTSTGRMSLSWTNNGTTAAPSTVVVIEREVNIVGNLASVGQSGGTSWSETTVLDNRRYRYRIRAEGPGGNSDWVYTSWVSTIPSAPSGFTATRVGAQTRAELSWGDDGKWADWDRVYIYRWSASTNTWSQLTYVSGSTRSYNDSTIAANDRYEYQVRTWNAESSFGGSAYSTQFSTTPAAPNDIVATRSTDTRINLTWKNNSIAEVDDIYVERSPEGSSTYTRIQTLSGSSTTYADTTTSSDNRYRYRLISANSAGSSSVAYSNYVSTTPGPPTSFTSTYVSDSQIDLAWAKTNVAPWTDIYISRSTNGGSYVQIATLSGSVRSWTDTGVSSNNRYRYQIRAGNEAGNSSAATSGYISTRPSRPTNLSATLSGQDIVLTWNNNDKVASHVVIDHAVDGVWSSGTTWTLTKRTTYTHTAPEAGRVHTYRIRSRVADPVVLYSSYTYSNTAFLAGLKVGDQDATAFYLGNQTVAAIYLGDEALWET